MPNAFATKTECLNPSTEIAWIGRKSRYECYHDTGGLNDLSQLCRSPGFPRYSTGQN